MDVTRKGMGRWQNGIMWSIALVWSLVLMFPVLAEEARFVVFPPTQYSESGDIRLSVMAKDASAVFLKTESSQAPPNQPFSMRRVPGRDDMWEFDIPRKWFQPGETINMTVSYRDQKGLGPTQTQSVEYTTYLKSNIKYASNVPFVIHPPFQLSESASVNVYVQAPTAKWVKVLTKSSMAPFRNEREMKPIRNKPGYWEVQIPTTWFSLGETIELVFHYASQDDPNAVQTAQTAYTALGNYCEFADKHNPIRVDPTLTMPDLQVKSCYCGEFTVINTGSTLNQPVNILVKEQYYDQKVVAEYVLPGLKHGEMSRIYQYPVEPNITYVITVDSAQAIREAGESNNTAMTHMCPATD